MMQAEAVADAPPPPPLPKIKTMMVGDNTLAGDMSFDPLQISDTPEKLAGTVRRRSSTRALRCSPPSAGRSRRSPTLAASSPATAARPLLGGPGPRQEVQQGRRVPPGHARLRSAWRGLAVDARRR